MENLENIFYKEFNRRTFLKIAAMVGIGIILGATYFYKIEKQAYPQILAGYEVSSGWIVTSYQCINEELYNDEKIEVFDSHGNSLGFYKSDFLEQIRIDGSGKGDGVQNSGKFLHYDYRIDDGKTYYLADKSVGAWDNELVSWAGEKPSVAVNPSLPYGTMIRFKDLGPEGENIPDWVIELLKTKTFYADDKFHGEDEKRIDIYVGLQKSRDSDRPESLLMHNVTVAMKYD